MKTNGVRKALLAATLACVATSASAFGQTTRWEDRAFSFQVGSAEVTFEKRIFEPGPEEAECMRCKHYVNLRYGIDEQDVFRTELDVQHLIAAYRYYAYVQLVEPPGQPARDGNWAAYFDVGLGRYDIDRIGPQSGYALRAGLDRKVTEACNEDGTLKKWFLDWELSTTYHRVEVPGEDLDYWSIETGPRILISTQRSRERAAKVGCPRSDRSGQAALE